MNVLFFIINMQFRDVTSVDGVSVLCQVVEPEGGGAPVPAPVDNEHWGA